MVITQLALVAALCLTLAATEVQGTCAKHYQSTLEFLLTLKETCDEAMFKDCCQVYVKNTMVTALLAPKLSMFAFHECGQIILFFTVHDNYIHRLQNYLLEQQKVVCTTSAMFAQLDTNHF